MNPLTTSLIALPSISLTALFAYKGYINNKKLAAAEEIALRYPGFIVRYYLDSQCNIVLTFPPGKYGDYRTWGSVNITNRRQGKNIYIPFYHKGYEMNLRSMYDRRL